MHKAAIYAIFWIVCSLCTSCVRPDAMKIQLLGTWVSEPVVSEWGNVVFEYTFREDESLSCTIRPAAQDAPATDTVTTEHHYCLEGNSLTIATGKPGDFVKGEINRDEILLKSDAFPKGQLSLRRVEGSGSALEL